MDFDLEVILKAIGNNSPVIVNAIFAIASITGLLLTISHLTNVRKQAKHGNVNAGKAVFGVLTAVMLISLSNLIGSLGETGGLAYGDVSYGVPTVASQGLLGYGADAINAVLAIARVFGVIFIYGGVKQLSESNLEGNTELSSSNSRSKGIVKIVCGTLLVFNPEVLDALAQAIH